MLVFIFTFTSWSGALDWTSQVVVLYLERGKKILFWYKITLSWGFVIHCSQLLLCILMNCCRVWCSHWQKSDWCRPPWPPSQHPSEVYRLAAGLLYPLHHRLYFVCYPAHWQHSLARPGTGAWTSGLKITQADHKSLDVNDYLMNYLICY